MIKQKQQQWHTLSGHRVIGNIATEVQQIIVREKALDRQLTVHIGTDSQVKGKDIHFATVIVFLRKGKGGFMYINKYSTAIHMTIKQRMLQEVNDSVAIAYTLCDVLFQQNIPIEVHVDINTIAKFKSNIALKEALGYIQGMGFNYKAKPYAFASSSCANKIVH